MRSRARFANRVLFFVWLGIQKIAGKEVAQPLLARAEASSKQGTGNRM
jgi:hypothetical protein